MTPPAALEAGKRAFAAADFEAAHRHLRAATAGDARNGRAWLYLGLAARELGGLDEAALALDHAVAIAPGDAHAAMVRARIELERGGDPVGFARKARQLAPGDRGILLGEVAALHQAGRGDEAISLLRAALSAAPEWIDGQRTLARLRWQMGDGQGALEDFAAATRARPSDQLLWSAYLGAASRMMGHDALLKRLPAARAAAGANVLFDMLEAEASAEAGLESADRLLSAIPTTRDIAFGLVRVRRHLRAGRANEAAAFVESLLGQPGDAAVWPYLSIAWRMLGDTRHDWLEGDPRLVSVTDLADLAPRLPALAAVLRGLHRGTAHPFDQSPRGGTQTDGPLFSRSDPEIAALRAIVTQAIAAHVAQLPPPDAAHPVLGRPRGGVRYAGSWSVRLLDGGYHVSHVHTHGWLSAALYVSLPSGIGADSDAGWLTLGEPPPELGTGLAPLRQVEPRPARLVLFPSIMWHGTRPFASGERLTVAFDAVPSGL